MIKLVTLLKRRGDMTRDEFEQRWKNVHAPMAAVFPGLRGYVLSFSILPGEPLADGVAQLWFDDRAGAQQSYASDIGRSGSDDATRYLSRRDHLLVSEQWVSAPETGAPKAFKLMAGYRRPPTMPRKDFISAFCKVDRSLLRSSLGSDVIRTCIDEAGQQLNSGVEGNLELLHQDAVFDALVEAWYDDAETLLAAGKTYQNSSAHLQLVETSASSEMFLLQENVIVSPPEEVQPARLLAG